MPGAFEIIAALIDGARPFGPESASSQSGGAAPSEQMPHGGAGDGPGAPDPGEGIAGPAGETARQDGARRARRGKGKRPGRTDPDDDALNLKLAFFPQTDLGNAERFVARNKGKFLWCPAIGWLFWDGKRWARDGADEQVKIAEHETVRAIQDEAEALARSSFDQVAKTVNKGKPDAKELLMSDILSGWGRGSEQASRLTPICKRAAPYLYVEPVALDADPLKINCANGTIVVRRPAKGVEGDYVSFGPHDPADMITKLAPVDYDPSATCPIYDDFIAYVQPNAGIRRFLHQWGGLSLTGDVSEQLLVFYWGKGKNGKSTLLVAWTDVAGDYSRTVPIETFINEGRGRNAGQATPDLAMLAGVRMVQASEPDRGAKLAEALIKLATGGDPMQVRFLNRDYFTLKPCFKLTMSGNYKPRVEGADEGIWRRVRLVPWKVTVPEDKRDRHLPVKLRAETSGILNRMLDGLRDWLDVGLVESAEVLEATAEYRRDSDPLGQFLDACVVPDAGGRVQSSVFHDTYVAWAEVNNASKWSAKGLANALKERGFKSHKSDVSWWLDVKLTKAASDFVDREGKAIRQGAPGKTEDVFDEF